MRTARTALNLFIENRRRWGALIMLVVCQILFSSTLSPIMAQVESGAQAKKKITGTITDNLGEPLIGVSVVAKNNPTIGAITDLEGNFVLEIPSSVKAVICTYIGYKTAEIPVDKSELKIVMEDATTDIQEVVVVAYGNQKKATVTGALTSISSKDLLQSPQANVGNALAGRLSGLTTTQASGEPGKDQATLRIRGVGTFADGEGIQSPLIMIDGIESSSINNLDPNEIENVTVLKDASSTAVYGVRGANGVILVTTKRGTVSKPQVSLSMNFATQSFANLREQMNAYNWASSFNEAISYDGYITGNYTPKFTNEELEKFRTHSDPTFYPDTDWIGLIFKDNSSQSQYNINVNGGTEKVKYFVSLGYFGQDGMFKNTDFLDGYDTQIKYKRYNFRTNFDFQVSKALSIALNVSDQLTNRNAPKQSTEYLLSNAFAHPPTSGPGIVDGKIINNLQGRYNFIENPLKGLIEGGGNIKEYQNQLNLSVRANLKLDFLLKGLASHATISYQNFNSHVVQYTKKLITYNAVLNPETNEAVFLPEGEESAFTISDSFGKNRRVYTEYGLDYSRSFGDHSFGGLLIYNQSKLYSPTLKYYIPNGYQGIVGRITYDYANRYMAEFNMGYNGTENFAVGKRFGFFPAVSLGWTVSEEKFFPKTNILSYLKIRGSYGEVGNDKIGDQRFLYMPTAYVYYSGTNVNYNDLNPQYNLGTVGSNYMNYQLSSEGAMGNPNLTWERAKKSNLGVEMFVWNDKIKITADVFQEQRKNILTTRNTIPVIVGANLPAYNLGEMENAGFESEITFRDKVKDLNYWIRGIYSFARNKITYMDEVQHKYSYQNATGHRYGQYFGLIAEGFYNTWEEVNDPNRPVYSYQNNKIQPGDVKYKDVNGDGKIDQFDMVPIGYSPLPEITYGISFGGDIKGFDFSFLFQGASNVSFNASKKSKRGFQEDGSAVDYLRKYSWTPERYESGAEIKFPHLSATASQVSNYLNSTLWIRDASYIRLKSIEVGYTFKNSLIKKAGLQSARVYVNGNNLITWSDLFPGEDPEVPSYNSDDYEPYPIVRTVNFGLNVKF